jgi:hypothetical protein
VNIQEIIAAIDAEIATLREARLLVAQSLVQAQINSVTRVKSRAVVPSKPGREPLAPARHELRIHGPKNHGSRDLEIPEVPVTITLIPAKRAPAQRGFKAVSKQRTALNAEIPTGPVAVPKKKGEEVTAFEGHPADGVSVSASAFGQAVTRGLMALDGKPAWPVIPTPEKATTQY